MKSRKKFIIVISSFNHGGIEILVERLCDALKEKYEFHIFILSSKYDQNLLEQLQKKARVYFPTQYTFFSMGIVNIVGVNTVLPIKPKFHDLISRADHIHATDSHSMIFIKKILTKEVLNPSYSIGNYHSEEYLWHSPFWFRKFELDSIKSLNPEHVFSMNQNSVDKLIKTLGSKFVGSKKMPAGIKLPVFDKNSDFYMRENKVVCLGRLVKFKSYIEFFIREIPDILIDFPDFEFHIYGDGPEREHLQKLSQSLPVYFHGTIELKNISKVLSSFKLFIGSGTSILTASALGIPSIIGIESCKSAITYGFLHETKDYDYQELGLNYELVPISKKVIEVLKATKKEYELLCNLARKRSEEFCITKTAKMLETAPRLEKQFKFSKLERFRYLCSVFAWTLLNKLKIISSKKTRHYIR